MTDIPLEAQAPAAPAGLSRRRALTAVAALAAGSLSLKSWAQTSTNWPLWEIRAKHGTVYLTGETPPRARPWKDERIERLLSGCAVLWNETNARRRQDQQALIKRYGVDSATPLMDKLSSADQLRLKRAAELAKVPLDNLASFRPWVVASFLESSYYQAMNFPEGGTAEKVLISQAGAAGVTLSSEFETNDDVMQFMGEMSPAEDLQFLQYTLDHLLDGTAENERVYSLWARGDMSGAAGMVARMRDTQPDLYKKHVIGRNQGWVPRIEAMLKADKPALVVIGLYHVAGPDGVPEQLARRGLSVRTL